MLLALLAFAAAPTPLSRCLASAHAMRPAQHCQAVEIERRDRLIAGAVAAASRREGPAARLTAKREQADWSAATEARCFALARAGAGSLGSMKAQTCRLDAQADRLAALERPLAE